MRPRFLLSAALDLGMTVLVRNPGWIRMPPMSSEELPGGTPPPPTVVDQADDSTLWESFSPPLVFEVSFHVGAEALFGAQTYMTLNPRCPAF